MNENFVTLKNDKQVLRQLAENGYETLCKLLKEEEQAFGGLVSIVLAEDEVLYSSMPALTKAGLITSEGKLLESMRDVVKASLELSPDGQRVLLTNPIKEEEK